MAGRVLYLVRHGQYQMSSRGRAEPDGPLTATGRQQAALVALRLRGLPVDAIHHSTLIRAVQTAQIIAEDFPDVPLRPSALLRECVPCRPEVVPDEFAAFFAALPASTTERGAAQAAEALATYFRQSPDDGDTSRHEVIVGHGNLITHLVSQAMGAPPGTWVRMRSTHGGISEVAMDSRRGLTLVSHNDTGHLSGELRTIE